MKKKHLNIDNYDNNQSMKLFVVFLSIKSVFACMIEIYNILPWLLLSQLIIITVYMIVNNKYYQNEIFCVGLFAELFRYMFCKIFKLKYLKPNE